MVDLLRFGPATGRQLLLAHGAGAPMDSDWMEMVVAELAKRGVGTIRFEFGYMAARRLGQRKPPPRAEKLLDEFVAAVEAVASDTPIAIGGKSLGGRVATMVVDRLADAGRVDRCVCLGYPFHPPGAPDKPRTAHLEALRTPTLICQGERDPFGTRDEVAAYPLSGSIDLAWLVDGDHDLRPRKGVTGLGLADNLAAATARIADFLR